MQNSVPGVSFATWMVNLNQIAFNFEMLGRTRHEEALPGVIVSQARLMSEAEAQRKQKPQELALKKMQAVLEETSEPEPGALANNFQIDYKAAVRDVFYIVQQELATREIEQKVKLKTENERTQEQLNAFEPSEVEETKATSRLSMKLNVISLQTWKQDTVNHLSGWTSGNQEPKFTLMHLDIYAGVI